MSIIQKQSSFAFLAVVSGNPKCLKMNYFFNTVAGKPSAHIWTLILYVMLTLLSIQFSQYYIATPGWGNMNFSNKKTTLIFLQKYGSPTLLSVTKQKILGFEILGCHCFPKIEDVDFHYSSTANHVVLKFWTNKICM